jgi:MFS family permease
MQASELKNLRHNFIANMLDGGFFGFALGFASFVTVIPLFISTMTSSAVLIGLIGAVHNVGWQLPQLFTADIVSRRRRFKPLVVLLTINERFPFLGLALVAWLHGSGTMSTPLALATAFVLLIWQGLGGGFTANAWQSMIAKIMPANRRGTFFGSQAAAANLLFAVGALFSGLLLERVGSPHDFTFSFLICSALMVVSWFSLNRTREGEGEPHATNSEHTSFWSQSAAILRRDANFRWFLVVRNLFNFASMAFGFYTVYAVRHFGMNDATAGVMTSVLAGVQIVANPLLGWLGDRAGYRRIMALGAFTAFLSAGTAIWAPQLSWFYLVFLLAGLTSVAYWTIGMSMTLEFGSTADRPAYIGLSNTLTAPTTILAPLIGGWIADGVGGYQATFIVAAVSALVTFVVLLVVLRDPRTLPHSSQYIEPAQDSH